MDYDELLGRVYDHLEQDAVDRAVMACLRIAKSLRDYYNTIMFLREFYPDKRQLHQTFYDETEELNDEARQYVWKKTQDDWIEERTFPFTLGFVDDESCNVLVTGVGEIDSEIEQWEKSIEDMRLPTGMGEYDTASFTDRYNEQKAMIRLRIKAMQTIKQRVKTRCLNYITRIEKQLEAQRKSYVFLQSVQTEVHNYFAVNSEDVYQKLRKAAQLTDSSNTEDQSLILTVVRRTIKSVADYFYPPVKGQIVCSDGNSRSMGEDQYLNRLQEFLWTSFKKSSSTELIQAEYEYLATVARKLNDIASKGVHANVSAIEAKQGLLSLYMLLYNVISIINNKHPLAVSE